VAEYGWIPGYSGGTAQAFHLIPFYPVKAPVATLCNFMPFYQINPEKSTWESEIYPSHNL